MQHYQDINLRGTRKKTKEELKKAEEIIEKAEAEDNQMVSGIFKNLEAPGGDLRFSYKKYKNDPDRTYHFEDGKKYTVPKGVAKHINNMTNVKQRSYVLDASGTPTLHTRPSGPGRQRYQFLSTDFM